jgi:hypothetical protein
MVIILPQSCEQTLLDRFLRAEAMALGSVRAAKTMKVPPHVLAFLHRHEADEQDHLRQFEVLLGTSSQEKFARPRVPTQWAALAVHLFGYEALGLEFAELLVMVRPDLASIVRDEKVHVNFFEREVYHLLAESSIRAKETRDSATGWWRRFPKTLDRYLSGEALDPYREVLREGVKESIHKRFNLAGLLTDL